MKKHEMNGVLIDLCVSLAMRVEVSNDNLFTATASGRKVILYHIHPGEWKAELYKGKPIRKLKATYVGNYTHAGVTRLGVRLAEHLGTYRV